MAPAAGPALQSGRAPMIVPAAAVPQQAASSVGVISPVAEMVKRDAIIAWYRGEFAAANAIIDALCNHLTQLNNIGGVGGSPSEYEAVFTAIHRRRLNWIPVLQMQKYFSIADVTLELRKVAAAKKAVKDRCGGGGGGGGGDGDVVGGEEVVNGGEKQEIMQLQQPLKSETVEVLKEEEEAIKCDENGDLKEVVYEDSPDSEITDTGSQEVQANSRHMEICDDHDNCGGRREQIKMTKGFVAKEPVKGHMVNVVKGLKMYEDVFTNSELCKLNDFVDEVRVAGQNGELLGETYILFNKQMKGNKREQIQLGVPIFGQIKDEATSELKTNIEPMPALLQSVIDHLVQWHILPENRKPNGCIINFFDEGEHSQPYLKPPHLDQPICTLLLSESAIAFGRTLICDSEGNYKGQLLLSLKGGSLLVMRNNSADMARHVMCPSPTRRVNITFFRVRPNTDHNQSTALAPLTRAMTLWQPGNPSPTTMPNGGPNGYEAMNIVPKWGIIRSQAVMLAPVRPVVMNPRRMQRGGTGVFLPWAVGSRKPARHLPPRAQKGRFLAFPSVETPVSDTMSDPGVEGPKMM